MKQREKEKKNMGSKQLLGSQKSLMLRLFKAALIASLVVFIGFAAYCNLAIVPNLHHLMASIMEERKYSNVIDFIMMKPVSKLVFKSKTFNPNPCDTVSIKNGRYTVKKNNNVSTLVSAYGKHDTNDEDVLEMLEFLAAQCDLNVPSEGESFSPVQLAIVDKHLGLVRFFIEHGARLDLVINRPGRPTHGMNAVQLARWLKEKYSPGPDSAEYAKIAAELERAH